MKLEPRENTSWFSKAESVSRRRSGIRGVQASFTNPIAQQYYKQRQKYQLDLRHAHKVQDSSTLTSYIQPILQAMEWMNSQDSFTTTTSKRTESYFTDEEENGHGQRMAKHFPILIFISSMQTMPTYNNVCVQTGHTMFKE